MYVIVVYDVKQEKNNEIRKFLRSQLHHVQNSVFHGELSKSQLDSVKNKAKRIVGKDESIIIYKTRSEVYIDQWRYGEDPDDQQIV